MTVLVIGLTGGIGAGKSTVARSLAQRGAYVIDVDGLGRSVLEPGGGAFDGVIAEFGVGVLGPDGAIDRAALARIVFSDAIALARLTAISHPAINAALIMELKTLPQETIVILDMAVLVESELGRVAEPYCYQHIVTVEAPFEIREERAVTRGSEREDVRRRMAFQATAEERRALADFVIDNDGTAIELDLQIDALWQELKNLAES